MPDGTTTGIVATLSLDQRYLSLVTERDNFRLLRDTQGLITNNSNNLKILVLNFLIIGLQKLQRAHLRVAKVRKLMDQYRDRATTLSGWPDMITADMIDFIKSDLAIFGFGILIFMVATLAFIFRSIRWVALQ